MWAVGGHWVVCLKADKNKIPWPQSSFTIGVGRRFMLIFGFAKCLCSTCSCEFHRIISQDECSRLAQLLWTCRDCRFLLDLIFKLYYICLVPGQSRWKPNLTSFAATSFALTVYAFDCSCFWFGAVFRRCTQIVDDFVQWHIPLQPMVLLLWLGMHAV